MRIGKLAQAVGCSIETIRFYESKGLLPQAPRGANNFRIYNEAHLRRLSFICYCRSLDISLGEIKLLLEAENSSEQQAEELNNLLDKHIKDIAKRLHELDHLRMELLRLKQKCSELTGTDIMQTLFQTPNVRFRKIK